MIADHIAGITHFYKTLNRTPAKRLVCGEYSECQIIKYEKDSHIFYFQTKILDEQCLFDWEKCNHQAILFDQRGVARYKEEQIGTGFLYVPSYPNMKIHMTSMPKKVPAIQIILVVMGSLILGVLIKLLLNYLGISFIP